MSNRLRGLGRLGERLAFHRDQHHGWRRTAIVLAFSNVALAAALAGFVFWHSTVYITVAATPDGRVIPMTPLEDPIMSDTALKNWAVTAVTEAFTLGHHDYQLRLSAVRQHFTDDGYEAFMSSIEESLMLERILENLQVASTVAQGAPVITGTRFIEDRVGWVIEFPILVTFQAGKRRSDQKMTAKVLVMRVPLSERASGVGIQQLVTLRRPA